MKEWTCGRSAAQKLVIPGAATAWRRNGRCYNEADSQPRRTQSWQAGETVKVADGYARNFLLPRNMAFRADSGSAKQIEHERAIIQRREEKRRGELAEVAKVLEGVSLEFEMRTGADEKLFGSVTSAHIAEQLAEKGHEVDRKTIHLEEPIKALGIYTVPVRLASGIEANIKVWVNGLAEEEPGAAEEGKAEQKEEEAT